MGNGAVTTTKVGEGQITEAKLSPSLQKKLEILTAAQSGNVGIGTTKPKATLHLVDKQNPANGTIIFGKNSGSGFRRMARSRRTRPKKDHRG